MMVVVIIGITTLIVLPSFVKSIRGNRLRAASRSVIMMGRYARSMAVLHQKDMVLTFQIGRNEIAVHPAAIPPPSTNSPGSAALPGFNISVSGAQDGSVAMGGAAPDASGGTSGVVAAVQMDIQRALDGVSIDYVEVEGKERETEGTRAIVYRLNGTCLPYSVRLADSNEHAMVITVDALSSAEAKAEGL